MCDSEKYAAFQNKQKTLFMERLNCLEPIYLKEVLNIEEALAYAQNKKMAEQDLAALTGRKDKAV